MSTEAAEAASVPFLFGGHALVSDGLRLVLPSFGAYTGGLDVAEAAIASLFAGPFHAYMLGHSRVYAIPRRIAV